MKKITLFLILLSLMCGSFVEAHIMNFSYNNASKDFILSKVERSHFINQPMDIIICDDLDGNVDGISEFDLTSIDDEISTDVNVIITYHKSQDDASNGVNAIADAHKYASSGETIYVRAKNILTNDYQTTSFNLEINIVPVASFDSKFGYELNPNNSTPLKIELIPSNFTLDQVSIEWYMDDVLISDETGLVLSSVRKQGEYTAVITFNSSGCKSILMSASVAEFETDVFPQGISPNSSPGLNDAFDLSSYDVTKLEIFNRNGIRVYSKRNYTNEWVGQTDNGEELPVGTYFYSMEYEGGTKKRSAWVYVNR
ncbi:MAG: gliding motility-associated C-terminal domain-containing protein [Winogradskyella sp.]|nr:gliding motility-associated C-terminal domain-containing protein [Winogradskyella sp.]